MSSKTDEEFDAFVRGNFVSLVRTGYLVCGDRHKAEDAAQDALLKVHARWSRISERGTYARRVLLRLLIDESRRPWRREVPTDAGFESLGGSGVHSDLADDVDQRDQVMRALARLTRQQRACVVLRYYLDLSVNDTAATLGCSAGNVKRHTSDALAALRGILTPDMIRS